MKNGKNPTRHQREAIKRAKLNPAHWLVVKVFSDKLEIRHREKETVQEIKL